MSLMRLQRFLSQVGTASRRESETLILQGKISLNGKKVSDLGIKVDPDHDQIAYQGKILSSSPHYFYYLLHKPPGVIVSKKDPQGRKTVFEMIPHLHPSVNAVGRLDYDSEGLLLLTNDGELAFRLTHPSFEIKKTYQVMLDRIPADKKIKQLEKGIVLEGRKTAVAQIKKLRSLPSFWFSIQIHEGKKRQVRRMFEWAGVKVLRLIRVEFASLSLGALKAGELRELSASEVTRLQKLVGFK